MKIISEASFDHTVEGVSVVVVWRVWSDGYSTWGVELPDGTPLRDQDFPEAPTDKQIRDLLPGGVL
jgi:hypothetical protein